MKALECPKTNAADGSRSIHFV